MDPHRSPRSSLQPPQFTTPALLLGTAGIAVLLAVLRLCSPYLAFAVFLIAGFILLHVVGNFLGTRLRDLANDTDQPGGPFAGLSVDREVDPAVSPRFAPRPGLGHDIRLGRGMALCVLAGSVSSAIGGTILLLQLQPGAVRWHHVLLAAASCGILGGLLTFWIVSFVWVFVKAIAEGHRSK